MSKTPPKPDGIFISYRRIDTNWATVSLKNHIHRQLPGAPVFMDIASINPGDDFVEAINQNVDQCRIMLAVIGPNWLTVSNNFGERRLDDPNDFVRLEITRALDRNIRLIPILVDSADMPPALVLPDPLHPLPRKNAVTVSHHSHDRDFAVISAFLDKEFPEFKPSAAPKTPLPPPTQPKPTSHGAEIGEAVADALLEAGVDAKTMVTIARAKDDFGDHHQALAIYQAAQEGLEATEGKDSDWALENRHNSGFNLTKTGRAHEAKELLSGLLNSYGKIPGLKHSNTLAIRHGHCIALLSSGKITEAKKTLETLLPICESTFGPLDPNALTTRRQWVLAALEDDDIETAKKAIAPLPLDGGDAAPLRKARTFLLRAWLADYDGDAAIADSFLEQADANLTELAATHYLRRELAKYRETRVPGGKGGTTLWSLYETAPNH